MFAFLILLLFNIAEIIFPDPSTTFGCHYKDSSSTGLCTFTTYYNEAKLPGSILYHSRDNNDNTKDYVYLFEDKCTSDDCYPYEVELEPGNWTFELWGTSGHQNPHKSAPPDDRNLTNEPGYGGYVKGSLRLEAKQKFFFYIGSHYGFNGGALGETGDDRPGQGGSATDIRLEMAENKKEWDNLASLKSRIMVAGAGGGQERVVGGHAGGIEAGPVNLDQHMASWKPGSTDGRLQQIVTYASGGTQTKGGTHGETYGYQKQDSTKKYDTWDGLDGSFGIGGAGLNTAKSHTDGGSGGGSGYYGGGGIGLAGGAGGGSSFISGHEGCKAIQSKDTLNPKDTKMPQIFYTKDDATYDKNGHPVFENHFDYQALGYNRTQGALRLTYVAGPLDPDPTPTPTLVPVSDPTPVPESDPTPVPVSDPTPVPLPDPTPVPENQEVQSNSGDSGSKSNTWLAVGIGAGAAVVLAVIAAILFIKFKRPEKMQTENFTTLQSPGPVITQDNPLYKDGNTQDDPFQNDFEETGEQFVTANQL